MFFYLSKILLFLLRPLVWGLVCLLFAWFTKDPDKRKRRLVIGILMLYLFSNNFLLNEVLILYEKDAVTLHPEEHFETAVVLGGFAARDDKNGRVVFYEASDRLLQAIQLYKKGAVRKILISGGSGSIYAPEKKESVFIREYLLDIGIPDSAIITETESRNTAENASFTRKKLDSLHLNGIQLLITSALHTPRAEACFTRAGVQYKAYPVNHAGSAKRDNTPGNIILPNTKALYTWELVLKEWTGLLVYKVSGKS